MEWLDSVNWGSILSFVGGGGFLWVLNYALNLRKQKKDEFVILRETWAKEDEKNKEKIKELEKKGSIDHEKLVKLNKAVFELKQAIEVFKLVDNQLPLPQWMKNKDLVMIDLNDSYEQVFLIPNGKHKADYIGYSDIDIWGEEIGKQYQYNDEQAVKNRKLIVKEEQVKLTPDKTVNMWIIKYPVFNGFDVIGVKGMAIFKPAA